MKYRNIKLIVGCCFIAAVAYGQGKGIAGKWGTDGAATKAASSVMLDLKVDSSNKVTGSIAEYGNALCGSPDTILPIDSGMVEAKVVTFITTRPNPCPAPGATGPVTGAQITWTGTLGDDDSMSVTRGGVRGAGGGGGGGRAGAGGGAGGAGGAGAAPGGAPGGGGGGGGRAGGGGAPAAGGPPAGGAPPAAAGAAPGGGPGGAPGGAPGGGGRGGGGRGALVMHRIP